MKIHNFRSIRRPPTQQINNKIEQPAPELPLPQTSTLRSRRKLANILVAAGIIFAACWAPHFFCLVCREFGLANGCSNSASDFFLLLGKLILQHSQKSLLENNEIYYNFTIILKHINRFCSFGCESSITLGS